MLEGLLHEIKNYVCALKGNAVLLRQRVSDPEEVAIVDRIERVVEKLETFALQSTGDVTRMRRRAPLDILETARGCVAMHFPGQADRFSFAAPDRLPPVLGDRDRLEQVFLNLFLNALEAGARRLQVRFRARNGSVEIAVEDDGCGCTQENLYRIFEPFYSSKAGSQRRGLGLFIVQSILQDHGCRVQVETKNTADGHDHGLVFTLAFPALFSLAWKRPLKAVAARPRVLSAVPK